MPYILNGGHIDLLREKIDYILRKREKSTLYMFKSHIHTQYIFTISVILELGGVIQKKIQKGPLEELN